MTVDDHFEQQLQALQQELCNQLDGLEGPTGQWRNDGWQRADGGGGLTRVLRGQVIEQGGIGYSQVHGLQLPASASATRPELADAPWQATGLSVVIHPRNPYAPTSHMNIRRFVARPPGRPAVWWFGGGFDLTPYYPFDEDIRAWHQAASDVCAQLGGATYARFKADCDRYFYLPHRAETRGVGGIFFDDLNDRDYAALEAFTLAVGRSYVAALVPLLARRVDMAWGERERRFQLYRRGRYVEFNLVYDRGTLFGLKSGGRTESILMSLPPEVRFEYGHEVDLGSAEAALASYLQPRDWLASGPVEG